MQDNFVFLAAADCNYVKKYGPAFVQTAFETNNPVHLHIINPDASINDLIQHMIFVHPGLTISTETAEKYADASKAESVTYYACARFKVLTDLFRMQVYDTVFVTDIDALFRKEWRVPEMMAPIGLYYREPSGNSEIEKRGMRVLAGGLWIKRAATVYAKKVWDYINSHDLRWFIDQEALFVVAEEMLSQGLISVHDISKMNIIDWDFQDDTVIWTGKGPRKYNNQTYVQAFVEATQRFEKTWKAVADEHLVS